MFVSATGKVPREGTLGRYPGKVRIFVFVVRGEGGFPSPGTFVVPFVVAFVVIGFGLFVRNFLNPDAVASLMGPTCSFV